MDLLALIPGTKPKGYDEIVAPLRRVSDELAAFIEQAQQRVVKAQAERDRLQVEIGTAIDDQLAAISTKANIEKLLGGAQ